MKLQGNTEKKEEEEEEEENQCNGAVNNKSVLSPEADQQTL